MESEIHLAHFNDVYHIPSEELLSRFLQLKGDFISRINNPSTTLTIFSGDGFSPSLEASVLKGAHMGPVLDLVGVDLACYGNHDFDFGDARLIELSHQVKFPWVLSNAYHQSPKSPTTGKGVLLASAQEYVIKTINGVRVGFFGLAGTDWPSNCLNLPPCYFSSPVEVAQRLARHLRIQEQCDLVIALTHMRLAEDMDVADATETGDSRVDLFLGGHDHGVVRRFTRDTDSNPDTIEQGHNNVDIAVDGRVRDTHGKIRIIKSGTDWRGLSLVRIVVHNKNIVTIHLSQYTDILQPAAALTVAPCVPSLARIRQTLTAIHDRVGALVQEPLLHCSIPLESRGSIVRSQETNLGNMLADALRAFYDTDIAFFNSGAIRCDRVFESTLPAGRPLLVRDIINICPFENPLVVKRISGRVLWQAIENSIGDMHMDGRFLQISGLRLLATWQRPAGHRVLELLLEQSKTTPQIINPEQMYTVAMLSFIARGYDDYTCLSGEETVVSEEGAMTDTELMLQILQGEELEDSPHVLRIKRAREVIVEGVNGPDCLPVIKPRLDGRIRFVECPAV